jgi:DNA-binding MarR family transcriptional regulator
MWRMTQSSLNAILHLFQVQARLEDRFSGALGGVHGLGLKEALLLMHLSQAPMLRLTRVDLAKRLHISASTVTRMAVPMEKLGLVARQPDPRDARLAYVVLTETGQAIVTDARATFERLAAEVFRDRWTEQDIGQLADLLARLNSNQIGVLA